MAKIELGPIANRISGTVGGAVFRGAGARAQIYQRPGGRGGNTAAQNEHRAAMAAAMSRWATLTPQEQLSWHHYAAQLFATEARETPQSNQGQAAFIRWYSVWTTLGLDPPKLWPYLPMYNAVGYNRLTVWLGAPPTQLFTSQQNKEPVGFALYLQPYPPGQGPSSVLALAPTKLRANRILAWNSRDDGGVWTQVPVFLFWQLNLGNRLADVTPAFPSGTWFQTYYLLAFADGTAYRGRASNAQKP